MCSAWPVQGAIHVAGLSQLLATSCLVHSNQALTVDVGATLVAEANEASTNATGVMTAAASDQAPVVADPFASLNVNPPSCSGSGSAQTILLNTTLPAGTHLQPINIIGSAVVTLAPGNHYFCKTVSVSGLAKLTGSDVVLVFENGAGLSFSGAIPVVGGIVSGLINIGPSISLSGRQSGPLAGFVIIADRTYSGTFTLQSDYITGPDGHGLLAHRGPRGSGHRQVRGRHALDRRRGEEHRGERRRAAVGQFQLLHLQRARPHRRRRPAPERRAHAVAEPKLVIRLSRRIA